MNKENLIELFRWYDENIDYFNAIGADYEDISIKAFRQLNFLNIPVVVGRSEQLIAFTKYVIDFSDDVNGTPESIVKEFLKSN